MRDDNIPKQGDIATALYWTRLHAGRTIKKKSWWLWLAIVAGWSVLQRSFGSTPSEALSTLITGFIPLLALFYGTAVIREEIEDQTLTYSFSRPLSRQLIYAARMLAAACPLVLLTLGPVIFIISGMHQVDIPLAVAAAFLSSVCFSGLFGLIGQLTRRPTWIGLVYLAFWEAAFSRLPGLFGRLTLTTHIEAAAGITPARLLSAGATEGPSPTTALTVLVGYAVVVLFLGGLTASRRSFQILR